MNLHRTFGQAVKQLRMAKGMLQKDLAARVGMDVTYLSKIEAGWLRPPSEEKIRAIAEVLGADPDELLLLAQKIPGDIPEAIRQSPKIPQFLRVARGLSDREWDDLIRYAHELVERGRREEPETR